MNKILIITLILSSCAFGPTQDKKSPLNYLNGEHYDQSANIFGVPVLKRKTKDTIIAGKVQMDDPFIKISNQIELTLIGNEKAISTVLTDKFGKFRFQGNYPDGDYLIKAKANKYSGELSIKITNYNVPDVLIIMK